MPVDFNMTRKVLVVHGVQSGTDEDLDQHLLVRELIESRLHGMPLDYQTELYAYENLNDAVTKKVSRLLSLFTNRLIARKTVKLTADIVGDVLINLADGSTAAKVRQGLRERILEYHDAGHPVFMVAHSLGSVYAFDVVNELIGEPQYFRRDSNATWPVQGLITIGSPLGLRLFKRERVTRFEPGRRHLFWLNYWDRQDPVVSGSFYGKPRFGYEVAERFRKRGEDNGWFIQDRIVDTGRAWLMAHVAYWRLPTLGDDLANLLAR
jgi:hypothetical protein